MPPERSNFPVRIPLVFPDRVPLSGGDRLMLAFDAQHRRIGGRGNICAFAAAFDSTQSAREVFERVRNSPLILWLTSLRLCRSLLGLHWKQTDAPPRYTMLAFTDDDALFDYVTAQDFDPVRSAPFSVMLANLGANRAVLLFMWHHALTDARGAESIIASLLFPAADIPPVWKPVRHAFSWGALRRIRRHIFSVAAEPRTSLARDEIDSRARFRYRRIHLTEAETAAADDAGKALGAQAFRSSIHLAAVCRAVFELLGERGNKHVDDFFLTVPHSLRRFAGAPLLGNRISYLFYRIPIARLTDDRAAVHHLIDASTSIIENELHRACDSFLRAVEVLPLRFVCRLLPRPSGGRMATFSFSDTGELFAGKDTVSIGLVDAFHLPPHFTPPGFTAVFTRLNGRLTIMLVAGRDVVTDAELDGIENDLRISLGVDRSKEDGAIHSM